MTCTPPTKRQYVTATLTKRVVSSLKSREFLRVALGFIDGKYFATPLERGAAAIMSMVKADGIVDIDRNVEGIDSGEEVRVELLSDLDSIKRKLVIIGSHDVAIDIIGDTIPVVSAHVGSMGGIFAMKNGACHIAPIHLLDAETGEYNIPFVKKYFGEGTMAIIKGLGRTQGLMVRRGDDRIKSVGDLKGGRFSFANRQSGAGTRLLFDYLLKKSGISKDEVNGYEKEFVTHLAVACAVQNGVFDCGLGVESAANAMGLDFIPVGQESYDFLVKKSMLQNEEIKNFIRVLKSDDFREKRLRSAAIRSTKQGKLFWYERRVFTDNRLYACIADRQMQLSVRVLHGRMRRRKKSHDDILSFEDVMTIIRAFHNLGGKKVRFTGGEPLLRKNAADFIYSVKKNCPTFASD